MFARNISRCLSSKAAITLLAAALLLSLAACGSGDKESNSASSQSEFSTHSPETSGQTHTVTETPTEEAPEQPNDNKGKDSSTDSECADLPNDPREAYASGTAPGRMPSDRGDDFNFWIADIDNSYDPCAPISWITFNGEVGDKNGPNNNAASVGHALALYVHGEPVNEVTMFDSVDKVSRVSDDAVDFTWGERSITTSAGITAHHTVRLQVDGDSVEPVSGDIDLFNKALNEHMTFMLGSYG